MTTIIIPETDRQFEEIRLKSVVVHDDGCELHRDDGFSFFAPKADFTPAAEQVARFYGEGIGRTVRGVSIEGRIIFYRTPEEEDARHAAFVAEHQEKQRRALLETKIPEVVTPGFEWTEDMAEISGFGGAYERACRQMISQGCAWWSEHPETDPQFHGFKNVTGICMEDNDDAKALSEAICAGDIGPSGAMHQAAVSHVFHWRKLGSWTAYQASMQGLARERRERGEDA